MKAKTPPQRRERIPLSLARLSFDEAVTDLLKVKPPAKQVRPKPKRDGLEDLVKRMREKA